jgi:polar amino acid transport system substrate-binding protein
MPRHLSLLFAFALTSILGVFPTVAADTLRVRADHWMPYNGDPQDAQPGYVVEILRAVFEPKGIKIDYSTLGWAEALDAAANNQIDAVIGANAREAAKLVTPQESIGEPSIALFTKKANAWVCSNSSSLKEVRIGVIEGYGYFPMLDAHIAKAQPPTVMTFNGTTPLRDAMERLDRGEIDVVPENYAVWVWNVRASGRSPANYRTAFVQPGEPIFVAFSPAAAVRFRDHFDEGLQQLRQSGKLQAILARYGLHDWR